MIAEGMSPSGFPLPNGCPENVNRALCWIAALTHYTIIYTRSWCANSKIARVRMGRALKSPGRPDRPPVQDLKDECTRIIRVPFGLVPFRQELTLYVIWYNDYRPHTTINGRTPAEVYENRSPANELFRFEPREHWPRRSRCAAPQAPVRGSPGDMPQLEIAFLEGRRHLPIIRLVDQDAA